MLQAHSNHHMQPPAPESTSDAGTSFKRVDFVEVVPRLDVTERTDRR